MSHDMSMGGMHGEDMGSGSTTSSSSSHGMGMVFHWVLETPIYAYAFTPRNSGQYVGAIFFLIVLSIIHRGILAYSSYKESVWKEQESRRKIVIATPNDDNDDKANINVSSSEETKRRMPWRWQVDAVRALLSTVKAGIHYLLMLAVMSLNVGYFFAVLVGVFLGDIVFARYGH
ncbi:hypothetical protein Dda_3524 [Drechslerella dactyloides]|uniref:Copper transport protein n=1 Tax=Drechslerella dactyloides TaxID=74499 RepID=A0AAD6IY64_DREDA|nr:hypothetical protein Dda_3524 [Drechslerella dactyloides]